MGTLQGWPITFCAFDTTLQAGTTTTITTIGSAHYCILGAAHIRTALTNQATPTTDAQTGVAFPSLVLDQGVRITIGLNAAGGVVAVQSAIEALNVDGSFKFAPQQGVFPDTMCPIGDIFVQLGSTFAGGTWIFGTDNLSSVTGGTFTFRSRMFTAPDLDLP